MTPQCQLQAPVRPDNRPESTAIHDMRAMPGRPKEKTASQYMAENPVGNRCSRCGETVPNCHALASMCWECTALLCTLHQSGYWNKPKSARPEFVCPDCGEERPKGKHRCLSCAKKHRRNTQRETMRKRRGAVSKIALPNP